MNDSERLLALYSAEIELRDGTAVVDVPERELELGGVEDGETYRIALLSQPAASTGSTRDEPGRSGQRASESTGPPVENGDFCEVEIEDLGEQGDGIARVGPGYIVFVPGTAIGDRVTVEITNAKENFAFAEVVEDEPVRG